MNGAALDAVESVATIDELIVNKKGGMSNKSSKATPKMHATTLTPSKHSSGKEQMFMKSGSAKKLSEVREFSIAEEQQTSFMKKNTGNTIKNNNNSSMIASNSKKQKQNQSSHSKNKAPNQ